MGCSSSAHGPLDILDWSETQWVPDIEMNEEVLVGVMLVLAASSLL